MSQLTYGCKVRVRKSIVLALVTVASIGVGLFVYSDGQARVSHTWDDIGIPSTISNGSTISSDHYHDILSANTIVNGRDSCEDATYPFSKDDPNDIVRFCWYKTSFGLISRGGTFVVPTGQNLAGFFETQDSSVSLLTTPNPDVVVQEVQSDPDSNGDSVFNVELVSAKASVLSIKNAPTANTPGTYEFTAKPGAISSGLSPKVLSYDGSQAWVNDNPLYEGVSFSNNGRWMVLSDPGMADFTIINLDTFDLKHLSLNELEITKRDMMISTITDDGRYLAVSVQGGFFRIYPTGGDCLTAYSAGASPKDGCVEYRDLGAELNYFAQQLQGTTFVGVPQFVDDSLLSFYTLDPTYETEDYFQFYFRAPHTAQTNYIALGDSYASGEGEGNNTFYAGTDIQGVNMCHLSKLSYPFLIGNYLGLDSTHSVACSGAKTYNIANGSGIDRTMTDQMRDNQYFRVQFDYAHNWTPGYVAQINYVKTYKPNIITVSAVGNDIGFSNIIERCIDAETCYSTFEDRYELVQLIKNQFTKLVDMYTSIKKATVPDARIYVLGYPSIVKPEGDCGNNVHLDAMETIFANELESYLNKVIQSATERAGVFYVDDWSAFDGHRLCEANDTGGRAVNGVTIGHDSMHIPKFGNILSNGSFHPTIYGHELLAERLENYTANFQASMPRADGMIEAPDGDYAEVLEDMPESGRPIVEVNYDDDLSNDVVYHGITPSRLNIGPAYKLKPGSYVQYGAHSDDVDLGAYIVGPSGSLSTELYIPDSLPVGFHTLYADVTLVDGQSVRLFKTIYVAESPDDLDGDGVPNELEPCLIFKTKVGVDHGYNFDCRRIGETLSLSSDSPKTSLAVANSTAKRVATQSESYGLNILRDSNGNIASQSRLNMSAVLSDRIHKNLNRPESNSKKSVSGNSSNMGWLWWFILGAFTFLMVVRYAMVRRDYHN